MKSCRFCQKIITTNGRLYCSAKCRSSYYTKIRQEKMNEKLSKTEHLVCEICGIYSKCMITHLNRIHGISIHEYMKKYNKTLDEVILPSVRKSWGDKIKGKNNGAYNHKGRFSPYSINFIKYDGLSEDEKKEKIINLNKKQGRSIKENQNCTTQVGYWIKQGYSKEEAQKTVSKRQTTFSLEKCIEKYGEEDGRKRWKERQDKWQNSLKSKPLEEQERINRSKFKNNGYSQISQKLFWEIFKVIKKEYNEIFFAELGNHNLFNNGEYAIHDNKGFIFPDFLIKDNNKIIEFDGDYWHGKKRGNQKRDFEREQRIINSGYSVFRVREKDYMKEPNFIIQECLNFIHA